MRRMTSYSSDIWRVGGSGCVGQDSNLGTPSGRDLESLAFDQAWLPTRGPAEGANQVSADAPADFKFEGPYDVWTQLGKGEKDFQSLLLGGKIRFRGSLPKIMALTSQLNRITQVAQQVPKEF